ncbi:MAG TPA: DoxX family protein [Acidobacteriaceae bacterium]|nr:DoxX family protein [Acidobacteriaceae bacterium]
MTKSKVMSAAFWIVTALFCIEMIFTAYWEWFTPDAAHAFARLGFSAASFRVELSVAKLVGVLALLIPALPGRVKEWAYAGFAFNLLSALVAHASIHDRPAAFAPSSITLLLGTGSYLLWRSTSLRQSPAAPKKSQSAAMREPTGGYATK